MINVGETITVNTRPKGSFKCYVTQVWGYQLFREKALQRSKVQCYSRYEGVGGPISRKKSVTKHFKLNGPKH